MGRSACELSLVGRVSHVSAATPASRGQSPFEYYYINIETAVPVGCEMQRVRCGQTAAKKGFSANVNNT